MSSAACTFQTTIDFSFEPDAFENTASIRFWHQRSARYGNTDNITVMITGPESEAEDYLRGLLASSITIFAFAVVWCILLLAFKCVGPHGAGWLSGRHIPLKPKPIQEDYNEESKFEVASTTWEQQYNKIKRARKILKSIVVFAGLSIVASSIMLSVKGVDSLIETLNGVDAVINMATSLLQQGVDVIDSVMASQEQLVVDANRTWDAINQICPEVRSPICSNITDLDTCNFDNIVASDEDLMAFLGFIADTRSLVFDELNKSKNDLLESIEFANSISDISETFNWAFWCSLGFSLATAIASLFFVYQAIWPPSRSSRCTIRNVFVIPFFVLLVVLSWTFAMVFVIGSVGLADMCYNSPDENFKALMARMEDKFSPLIYKSVIFYVSGCPIDLVPSDIVLFLKYLVTIFESIQAAAQSIDGEFLADVCDDESGANARDATQIVHNSVCGAAVLLDDFQEFLQCANWYPLYETGVYDTMCYEGASGFSWVTSTQIAIVVLSMVILSLRIVFSDIEIEERPFTSEQDEAKAVDGNGAEIPNDNDTSTYEEQAPSGTAGSSGKISEAEEENEPSHVLPTSSMDDSMEEQEIFVDDYDYPDLQTKEQDMVENSHSLSGRRDP